MKQELKKTALSSIVICSILFYITSCININIGNGFSRLLAGNGVMTEKIRGVTDFDAIDVRGSIDVIISDRNDASITVSGDENLIDSIKTQVDKGTLNIYFKNGIGYTSKVGLRVTVPNNGHIKNIKASGSSDVTIEGCIMADDIYVSGKGSSDIKGNIKAGNCELNFSGSSDYKGMIEAANCKITCSGSSDCVISGNADICDISMSGSSDFKGYDFVVKKFTCSAFGSSDVQVTCTEELYAKASGSSDIYYKGSAKVMSVQTSGSSDLHHK
jgi:hypothetical protein